MDEYTLLDGDKNSVTDGVPGALTAIPNFTVTHLLFADDLAFVANRQPNLQALLYTDHFKYLGMMFDKNLNLSAAADAALQPFMNGTFKIQRFAQEYNLANRLHALIWLLKTYSIPAGMYASQIWATPFLKQGKEMDSPLQKWLLATLKRW
eukprot:CAMPEP_0202367438 /NCGR_PEP_ID=MMETSP1126-20121109/17649_1 /ASSEMBLY_ACC=CAM_ASM_000457 /TAXON_ID=3047 /ORGANISM="Dunaliella tertiolecta, Strain CCMP1320" /LENGTH=150 /DNA_ID=CAMNT_0048962687 /DNA_START=459 /DNA_END=908 /DNA_ORIENTATION=+